MARMPTHKKIASSTASKRCTAPYRTRQWLTLSTHISLWGSLEGKREAVSALNHLLHLLVQWRLSHHPTQINPTSSAGQGYKQLVPQRNIAFVLSNLVKSDDVNQICLIPFSPMNSRNRHGSLTPELVRHSPT